MSNFRFEPLSGSDATFDRQNKRVLRRYRAIDTLPTSFFGDAFDRISEYAISWVLANQPFYQTPWGILPASSIQIHENHYALNYEITVEYSPFGENGQGGAGAYQITIDTSGGTVHVTAGKCIGVYGNNDPLPSGLVGKPTAIGDDGNTVEGVDIPIAQPKINVMFRHPTQFLTRDYARNIGKLVGYPNSDSFLGYDPGEVMYLGGPLTETNTESSATDNFAISYNRTNFDVGGITISQKYGHDLLVPVFMKEETDDKPTTVVDYFKVVRPAGREWKEYKSVFGWG